jgi:alpha-D-ribose 1-methylphosphonate 5-triphosphate diphosphatase
MIIANARVVTPDEVVEGGVVVRHGQIAEVFEGDAIRISKSRCDEVINAKSRYLLPGLVDLHGDDLETEISPRPFVRFPVPYALVNLDRKVAACGITTKLHAICNYEDELKGRDPERSKEILETLGLLRDSLLVDHSIHARCEIRNGMASVFEALDESSVKLISIMDHFPGQGQFRKYDHFRAYYAQAYGLDEEEIKDLVRRKSIPGSRDSLAKLLDKARGKGIPIASHDDDTEEKVEAVHRVGARISEFPVTMEAARRARELDMMVSMGAPNAIRGRSSTGNLSALEAIEAGLVDILCSDYNPASMIYAPFLLAEKSIMSLPAAVKMVSLHPARAMGIDKEVGSIQAGKKADLIMVEEIGGIPVVMKTIVGGRVVFSAGHPPIENSIYEGDQTGAEAV